MKVLLLLTIFVVVPVCATAVPLETEEFGTVPERVYAPSQDQCRLQYYNICCGWVDSWSGYCRNLFENAPEAPVYGTCFDLSDCPGGCRHLTDVWWACKRFTGRGLVDVEIYCADGQCCPVGPPLAAIYGYNPDVADPWQHLDFGGLALCTCDEQGDGRFIVMITDHTAYWDTLPYSDINGLNIEAGCETEWRCQGHSFVYRNAAAYCDVYGEPGPMWRWGWEYGCTNYPPVPPGCHDYHTDRGFFVEWLIDCYLSCVGPTSMEGGSWSEIKALYR